jgi:hypothetical protein
LRAAKVDAPVFVSVASKCLEASNGGTRTHDPDNPVTRAQKALPDSSLRIKAGVDTDALLTESDRMDDCHMGASAEVKVAHAWAQLLLGPERPVSAEPRAAAIAVETKGPVPPMVISRLAPPHTSPALIGRDQRSLRMCANCSKAIRYARQNYPRRHFETGQQPYP